MKKINKCYIVTYYQYNNYGTRLQNFAMVETMKTMCDDVSTIAVKSLKREFIKMFKCVILYLPHFTIKQKSWYSEKIKGRKFKEFNKNLHLKNIKYSNLEKLDFSNSIVIAGSDQIWSPKHLSKYPREIHLNFLKFAPSSRRVSYAPSFGVSKIPRDMLDMYVKGLEGFSLLSVRENEGKKIMDNISVTDVEIMPDPVFLLSKEQWSEKLYLDVNVEKDHGYYLLYFLDNNQEVINKIKDRAHKAGKKLIIVNGNNRVDSGITATPEEFLKYIKYADIVFTDSFHGSAFSIIFETKFYVFQRSTVKQFSRIQTLLTKYNCESCIVNNIDEISELNLLGLKEYEEISKIKVLEKKKGMEYLYKAVLKVKEVDKIV